jgi:hypothetical protein
MSKPIMVKNFECWNMSISMLWGKTPKVSMLCGKCYYSFSRRFEPIDFRNGYPKALCPSCSAVNYVPITVGK